MAAPGHTSDNPDHDQTLVDRNKAIMQEGVQAQVDFQHPTTRHDALVEMLNGLTSEMQPETAWLRRSLRGLEP